MRAETIGWKELEGARTRRGRCTLPQPFGPCAPRARWSVAVYLRGRTASLRGLAIRAFVRLEKNRIATGMSWAEAKLSITRDAIRAYLAKPTFTLGATA